MLTLLLKALIFFLAFHILPFSIQQTFPEMTYVWAVHKMVYHLLSLIHWLQNLLLAPFQLYLNVNAVCGILGLVKLHIQIIRHCLLIKSSLTLHLLAYLSLFLSYLFVILSNLHRNQISIVTRLLYISCCHWPYLKLVPILTLVASCWWRDCAEKCP